MRQSLQMMSNPNAMQEAMRHQDMALSRLENHPEGFNALRRMYEDVQEPLMEATQNAFGQSNQQTQQQQPQSNPWASNTPNTAALPNPWGRPAAATNPNPFSPSNFGGMMGGAGMPGMPNLNDPNAMAQMMRDPMVQQMLQNPEVMMQVKLSHNLIHSFTSPHSLL